MHLCIRRLQVDASLNWQKVGVTCRSLSWHELGQASLINVQDYCTCARVTEIQ